VDLLRRSAKFWAASPLYRGRQVKRPKINVVVHVAACHKVTGWSGYKYRVACRLESRAGFSRCDAGGQPLDLTWLDLTNISCEVAGHWANLVCRLAAARCRAIIPVSRILFSRLSMLSSFQTLLYLLFLNLSSFITNICLRWLLDKYSRIDSHCEPSMFASCVEYRGKGTPGTEVVLWRHPMTS